MVSYDDDGGAPGGPALTGTDGLDAGGCCWEDSAVVQGVVTSDITLYVGLGQPSVGVVYRCIC